MEPRRWLRVDEAADRLALSKKTLYSLAARGRLPDGSILKIGKAIRFDIIAIETGLTASKGRSPWKT